MNDRWQHQSLCRDVDPNIFFAERGRLGRGVMDGCIGCPVRKECLAFAVESPWVPFGVWGGLPTNEVRRLWRDKHPSFQQTNAREVIGFRKDRSTP
jgi:WhiB family redox-sensing transcriptional regulator